MKTIALITLIAVVCLPVVFHVLIVIIGAARKGKIATKRQTILVAIVAVTWIVFSIVAAFWALSVLVGEYFPMSMFMIIWIVGAMIALLVGNVMFVRWRRKVIAKAPEGTPEQKITYVSNKFSDNFFRTFLPVLAVEIVIFLVFAAIAIILEILVLKG